MRGAAGEPLRASCGGAEMRGSGPPARQRSGGDGGSCGFVGNLSLKQLKDISKNLS